jgi:hypothetical protein
VEIYQNFSEPCSFFQTKFFPYEFFQLYWSSTVKFHPLGSFSKNRTSVNEWQIVVYVVCETDREEGSCRVSEISSGKSETWNVSYHAGGVRQIGAVMSGRPSSFILLWICLHQTCLEGCTLGWERGDDKFTLKDIILIPLVACTGIFMT